MLKKCTALFAAILLLLSLCACTTQTEYYEKSSFAMGSAVTIRIYGSQTAQEMAQDALAAVSETDSLLSANMVDSDIYKLNESKKGHVVSAETFQLIRDCLSVCRTTGWVLDITIGAVSALWGFDTDSPSLPEENALHDALQSVDMAQLTFYEDRLTIQKAEGQQIDLGAFGKGIACDKALQALRSEFSPAILSVGGTVMLYGNHPDEKHWTIGVRDPLGSVNTYCATLALSVEESDDALVISTSGNYEKTFTENGQTYHHILDINTGYPVENDLLGVTVVAKSGLVSDALSTVLFMHGLTEQSLHILESYNAQAVFLCKDGRMLVSDGLADKITITNGNWTLGDLEDTIGELQ